MPEEKLPQVDPDYLERLRSEGWITDKSALYTLLLLKGLKPGDELAYNGKRRIEAVVCKLNDKEHCEHIYRHYSNPGVSVEAWTILAWRRRTTCLGG